MKNKLGVVSKPYTIDFIEREIPPLKPGEALIRIHASAICGSDLHIFKGKHPSVELPVTIGHELAGVIEELGAQGEGGFSIGDRVVLEPALTCGVCDACRHGEYSYCENISFTYRNGDGAMAHYIVAQADRLFPLPDALSFSAGALIEPLAVAVHAVRRAEVKLGDRVAVFGAGAIGILVASVCAHIGADVIAISDPSEFRLQKALEMGATHAVNPNAGDVLDAMQRITGGKGMDKTFECVGLNETFHQAMFALKKNGVMTNVGIFESREITIDASRFVTHEIRVQGSQSYCWDFPLALSLAKRLPLEQMVTHHFPLADLQQAMDTALDRSVDSMKIVLHPQGMECEK